MLIFKEFIQKCIGIGGDVLLLTDIFPLSVQKRIIYFCFIINKDWHCLQEPNGACINPIGMRELLLTVR